MIGRKEWFTRRKYSGWGLTPKTWQGFAYIGIIALLGLLLSILPVEDNLKILLAAVLIITVLVDTLQIMASLHPDEREAKIEALAERNASWTMVGCLAILVVYLIMAGDTLTGKDFIPYLLFPILSGTLVKGVSTYVLQKREL